MSGETILILDDDPDVVDHLCESLGMRGYRTRGFTDALAALEHLRQTSYDLVLSDVEMPRLRGVDLLREVLDHEPSQLVMLITAFGSVELAVEAVQAGACDFVTKPFKMNALVHAIERAFSERLLKREVVRLRSALAEETDGTRVVAKSPAMRRVLDLARRAAGTRSPVLITGETGSGKSMLARYVHESSKRREAPFVQLNCAAMPPTLAEAELFGVRKGAFTDAHEDRPGLFVSAGPGTLFLDELGELSLEVQAKLLHALESGSVRPVGGTREVPIEARVIAATNRDPEEQLRAGTFRPDLYYRINVVRLEVPPLRTRKDDITPLVDTILARARLDHERPLVGISAKAIRKLLKHSWPGNVRELANVLERAVAMADHDVLLPEDLDFLQPHDTASLPLQPGLSLEEMERAYVAQTVDAHDGNKAAAARALGITRRTLYRKLGEQ